MSNELREKLEAILAAIGFNDGANKGFWRIQPRDDEGQWMEMGGTVLFRFRTGQGNLVVGTARGTYVGPSGKPGKARVLVSEGNEAELEPGIYELDSRNLTQAKAILPDAALVDIIKSSRKDKFGKPVKSLADSQLPTKEELEGIRTEPTADDERLARGELTEEEKAAEQDGRKNSPIADLPAGFEAENPDEVKKLLRDSGVDPEQFDKSQEVAQEEPSIGDPISEIFADVAYNGDTEETLDKVLDKVASTPDNISKRAAASLQPGEVFLNSSGEELTVVDIKNVPGNKVEITAQTADGRVGKIPAVRFDKDINVVKGKKGKIKPAPKPAAKPEKAPEAPVAESPEAPEAPETPEATPDESPEIAPEDITPVSEMFGPIDFPPAGRIVDEVSPENQTPEDITFTPLSEEDNKRARNRVLETLLDENGSPTAYVDENGKLYEAQDPFEMMNALAEAYPSAKFTKDGALIIHRQADKDGKIFELRANNTGKKAIAFSVRFTDPKTGEFEEFYHKNDHHSASSLFGKHTADQILETLLSDKELYFGKRRPGSANYAGPDATLRQRAKVAFKSGPTSDTRHKMVSIRENVFRLAEGRNAVYHEDGTIKDSEIPDLGQIFEEYLLSGSSAENRDDAAKEDMYHIMYSIFGRMPLTTKAHEEARKALRDWRKQRFPEISLKDRQTFEGLVSSASERMRGIYRNPDSATRSIRYASKDRTRTIEPDMVVEYTNNVGDTSIVKVSKLVKNTSAVPGDQGISYNFGDYVIITDKNGTTRKLNSLKLRILKDQATPLTKYTPNLVGAELTDRRQELGLYGVPGKFLPEKIPGEDTAAVSDTPSGPMLVEEFGVGDILPNLQGVPQGEILSIRPVKGRNGADGLAFIVRKEDGTTREIAYKLGTELELKKA